MLHQITMTAVPNIPLVREGDDLGVLIVAGLAGTEFTLADGDVVVVAQKVVSKAEGRIRQLADVVPGAEAEELGKRTLKDPRLVQVILDETREIVRVSHGVLIVEQRNGLICANAGVDRSNVDGGDSVVLLPLDPDSSARQLRDRLAVLTGVKVAVIINDSHGRPWRDGASGVAIGIAGLAPLEDRRGDLDLFGYELQHTVVALADQVASAASLLQGQGDEGRPVIVVRGVRFEAREASATEILRPRERDLFR
jgi:coenzyme F420-0:L-glutamate ligase / coenzyme F420-1:gamma-L-glutamate ligase